MWLVLVVAAIALTSATYAWFINNSRVTAEKAEVIATTADYLLISADGAAFGTSMTLDNTKKTLTPISTTDDTLKKAVPDFFKVKNNDQGAWVDANGTPKAAIFEKADATNDYYHDTIYLKSSTANADVKAKLNVKLPDSNASHAEEAMYVAFVPVEGTDTSATYGKPVIYQLAGSNKASTSAGANTNVGDGTTDNYTTSGIKSIQTNGTLVADDKGDLTIINIDGAVTALTFATLTTADTPYQYEVYVWMEGTDPQCYNTVSATNKDANVNVSLEFYTGDYPS